MFDCILTPGRAHNRIAKLTVAGLGLTHVGGTPWRLQFATGGDWGCFIVGEKGIVVASTVITHM